MSSGHAAGTSTDADLIWHRIAGLDERPEGRVKTASDVELIEALDSQGRASRTRCHVTTG